jgi:hypothetical protein
MSDVGPLVPQRRPWLTLRVPAAEPAPSSPEDRRRLTRIRHCVDDLEALLAPSRLGEGRSAECIGGELRALAGRGGR